jgi:KEOPS complex subunit Pcc1
MTEKASATLRLVFPSDKTSTIIFRALKPETRSSVTYRSRVKVSCRGRMVKLEFEAEDTTALRASMNSFLSWLQLLSDLYGVLETD